MIYYLIDFGECCDTISSVFTIFQCGTDKKMRAGSFTIIVSYHEGYEQMKIFFGW